MIELFDEVKQGDAVMVTFKGSSHKAEGAYVSTLNGVVTLHPGGDYHWCKFPLNAIATVSLRNENPDF